MANSNYALDTTDERNAFFWVVVVLVAWTLPFIFGLVEVSVLTEQAAALKNFELSSLASE